MNRIITGKNAKQVYGKNPAIALINPKYEHNVAGAIRAASCFGFKQVWFTGNRIKLEPGKRLPREERMKGFMDVELIQNDYLFDQFRDVVPVAVEVRENSEKLPFFEHPENALYVFGPEDGSIPSTYMRHCHRFVTIPMKHCANLASAIYMMLSHRMCQRVLSGAEEIPTDDTRGFIETPEDNHEYTLL